MAHSACWAIVTIADIATLQGLSEGHLFSLLKRNELKCAHWPLELPKSGTYNRLVKAIINPDDS